jgi:peptidoglycan/xylan/chitin deacetylase (PgdA/CDA1 family)
LRDERAAQDDAVPQFPAARGALATRPLRRKRRVRLLWVGLAVLVALVLATSTALAAVGAIHWPLGAFAQPTATATATDARTFVGALPPTATPTPSATATPQATATSGPIPPIHLGCPAGALHPRSYVVRNGASSNGVALTFDDGPSPDYTANMLTTLEQTHTPATFFVVGASVQKYATLIRREAADGAIGMHTWDHPYMTKLDPAARAWEIASTADAIHQVLGANYCLPYWRPPFGDYNDAVFNQMFAAGLTTITWDNDPQDWSSPGVQTIVNRVLAAAHPGSIILLHDGYFFRQQTAAALPLIIQGLHQRGLVPMTIPQLLGGFPPQSPAAAPATSGTPAQAQPLAFDAPIAAHVRRLSRPAVPSA